MAKTKGFVAVNVEECKGCMLCVEACPVDVLHIAQSFNTRGYNPAEYDGEGCTGCGVCYYACPEPGALTVYKNWEQSRVQHYCRVKNVQSTLVMKDTVKGIATCDACGQDVILSDFRQLSFVE